MKQTIEIPEGYKLEETEKGVYKVVPEKKGRWKPKYGETYCYVMPNGKIQYDCWTDNVADNMFYKVGNCFKTSEEAKNSDIYKAFNDEYEYWYPSKPLPSDDTFGLWEVYIDSQWKKELVKPSLWGDSPRRRLKER